MVAELAGWTKLTELVTDHVLGDKYRDVDFTVMNSNGMANEFWRDGAGASPGFDNGTIIITQSRHFLGELEIYEWSFFQ